MKKYRPSVFVVTYVKGKEPEYLILKRKRNWIGWEFPKGGIKKFEFAKKTIKRELKEEAGLDVSRKNIKKYQARGTFLYKKKERHKFHHDGQKYSLYSAGVKKKKVNLKNNPDHEHSDYRWVSFKKALKMLTWPNQRKCLRIVDSFLNQQ